MMNPVCPEKISCGKNNLRSPDAGDG